MKIGIFAPFGDDHERNIAFCRDVGAGYIGLQAVNFAGWEELARARERYKGAGVDFSVLTPPRITTEALLDERLWKLEVERQCRIIADMGRAGLEILHLYVSSVHAPSDPQLRERLFQRLIEYYRRLVEQAEASRVKMATHTYNTPAKLVWNYETMARILNTVSSAYNGVLFCTGKTQLAGDDMGQTIRRFGPKIFLVHIRNIGGDYRPGTYEASDGRHLEVRFDLGDVDMVAVFRTLKEIGYSGPFFPEHYPAVAGDQRAGLAWTIGYFKALEAALEM